MTAPSSSGPQDFPETRWSRIVGRGSGASTLPDIEALAAAYWLPVYGYVRASRGASVDDAKDATQDFFMWMLERGFFNRADPERGRFRGFLKVSLRNFLNDRSRTAKASKRGGDRMHLRLDFGDEEAAALELAGGESPEVVLDSLWRAALVERATETLEAELRALGKTVQFEVFRDYFLNDQDDLDYKEVAARYDLTASQVSNYLMHAKKRYRTLLRTAVMETVSSPEELDEELTWLFGAPAS